MKQLTDPKVVRSCILAALFIFLPGLIFNIIMAVSFGGTRIGPGEYNIWDNWISDMGSVRFSPTPFVWDAQQMICAILLVPIFLYLKENFGKAPLRKEGSEPKLLMTFSKLGFFWFLLGLVGLFGVGVFSEDRTTALYLHEVFSAVVFGSFALGALFIGFVVILKKTMFPKIFGYFMIVGPPAATIVFAVNYLLEFTSIKFLEWMMLFSIFIWLIPFSLILIKQLNTEI